MKVVKLRDDLYKRAERVSRVYGVKVDDIIAQAINEGIEALSERNVIGLYRDRKITLQKAAEVLSLDIWEMLEKLKKADIHIDYSVESLKEDLE